MSGDIVFLVRDYGTARVEVGAHVVGHGLGDTLVLTPAPGKKREECDYQVVFGNG